MSGSVEAYRSVSGHGPVSDETQILTFIVNGEEFGVDILRVQEIRGWSVPMPFPQAPAFVKGLINIRGDVVPIADLRERLGLPSQPHGPTTVIVILRVKQAGEERMLGVIVDAMSDVTNIPATSIRAVPTLQAGEQALARGIAVLDEKMITLLDVDAILGGAKLAA